MRLRLGEVKAVGETKDDWIKPHFHLTQDPAHFISCRLQPVFPMLTGGQSSRGCMEGLGGAGTGAVWELVPRGFRFPRVSDSEWPGGLWVVASLAISVPLARLKGPSRKNPGLRCLGQ